MFDDEIAKRIAELEREIKLLKSSIPSIPRLSDDPTADSPLNLWMLYDGRLRGRKGDGTIVEYDKLVSAGTTTSADPPPAPAYIPTTRVLTLSANWDESYNKGGSSKRSTPNLYFGRVDGYNQEQKSMVGFTGFGPLAAGAAGSRILKVEFYIRVDHTYPNAGCELRLGIHNSSSSPATFTETGYTPFRIKVKPDVAAWYQLPVSVGNGMRDGTIKGITLNQRSTSTSLYGYANGIGSGYTAPQIRITYVN